MTAYKVTGMGWFVVEVPTKRNAYSEGVEEWGRGGVDKVERATQGEIDYFKALKGEDALMPRRFKVHQFKEHLFGEEEEMKDPTRTKKELTVTVTLNYEPVFEHSKSGNCRMKCPLGDCILNVVLENSLKYVVQAVDIKAKTTEEDK